MSRPTLASLPGSWRTRVRRLPEIDINLIDTRVLGGIAQISITNSRPSAPEVTPFAWSEDWASARLARARGLPRAGLQLGRPRRFACREPPSPRLAPPPTQPALRSAPLCPPPPGPDCWALWRGRGFLGACGTGTTAGLMPVPPPVRAGEDTERIGAAQQVQSRSERLSGRFTYYSL